MSPDLKPHTEALGVHAMVSMTHKVMHTKFCL